jgi:DNA-binding LacI/PurR family transcriptional regulator
MGMPSHQTKKVTIYDVAKKAGVTATTVSRVINGKTNVALETREKVLKAIEELNYYPSPLASGLHSHQSNQIGILVPFFFGEFFYKVLSHISQFIPFPYEIVLYDAATPEIKTKTLQKIFGEKKLNGLIIISLPLLKEEAFAAIQSGLPLVLLDNSHPSFPSVYFDNVMGFFNAVQHLTRGGHTRIALINGALEDPFHLTVARNRFEGYKLALEMAKIPFDPDLVFVNDWSRPGARFITHKILKMKNRPTAIVASSDLQAIGVLEACREAGVAVPEEISVVGYDDMDFADFFGLTTVQQSFQTIAKIALDMLLQAMQNPSQKPEQVALLPTLVIRKTTRSLKE